MKHQNLYTLIKMRMIGTKLIQMGLEDTKGKLD